MNNNLGNQKALGENLQSYMDRKGVDRHKIAEVTGVNYSSVGHWLSGKTYPRIEAIEKMANFFGIDKSDLIEDKSNRQPDAAAIDNKYLRLAKAAQDEDIPADILPRYLSLAVYAQQQNIDPEDVKKIIEIMSAQQKGNSSNE